MRGRGREEGSWLPQGVRADATVLTKDRGTIPIAEVQDDDLIWDGIEFVQHGGLLFLGFASCIIHEGLIATRGLNVYIEGKARPVPFMVVSTKRLAYEKDEKTRRTGKLDDLEMKQMEKYVHAVYTLIDCGPRHRFACDGHVAHNLTTR